MAQLLKQIIKGTSFLLILILSTSTVFAGKKSKKKSTKTKTTTTKKTATSETTTKVEKKKIESKVSEEEQISLDLDLGKKLASSIKNDTMKEHSASGLKIKRYTSNEEGKIGADILEVTKDSNLEISSITTVLKSYIINSFEYKDEDAETLSNFIVKYNTINRNNQDHLIKNYSTNVVLAVKKEMLGIPANATEENIAGNSQIIIPTEKNILKKYALDVASLELLDQTKTALVLQDNGDDLKGKMERFLAKKSTSENEELNNRMMTASPMEVKGLSDRLALNKKREDMKKANMTSEKEYTAFLDSKNKKETTSTTTSSTSTKSTTTTTSTSSDPAQSGTIVNSALPSGPVVPKNKFTTFISGTNHPGINAREFLFIPGSGILAIGYEAGNVEKKDLRVFMTSTGDYQLKRSSEGIKLAPESPLVYSNGKVYVIELLKNDAYIAQFNSELEFELRSEAMIIEKSTIQVFEDEVIVTAIEKTGSKDDVKVFKAKDLSFIK